ncbi:MAG: hypothetical protein Q9173_002171 [Seirophora scorigena]
MGPTIPHKDAWTRARDRYVEDLSKEEVALYQAASPESIFYDASAAEKIHTSSSRGVKVADKLRPLIAAIEQYGKALDIYANAYPLVLSPLWGSIRIVLHLAREFGKYFERIVDMFASIGDLLPRFRVYENLFPSHERLVQALSITYVDILAFCTKAKAVFRRERRMSLTNLSILFKSTWKPFEQQFGQKIDDFRAHVKNVEKEAGLSHMIEASDSRAVVLANQRRLEKAKKEDAHRRIIAAIPSVDHIAKHRKLQSLRQDGTGTWILRHQIYQDWYDAACSSTICCSGIPGCGKTILASSVVDALRLDASSRKYSIVYYYCDYADQRTLQAETILGTLLKQFFVNSHIPEAVAKRFPPGYGDYAHSLDVSDLIDLVCLAIEQTSCTVVIVDGLDECEKNSRKEILNFFNRLQRIDTSIIKAFVSCRQEDQLLRSLQGVPIIHMTSSTLEDDIRLFVAASVNSRITNGELRVRDPNLAKEITDELVNKAHGMFLWVFFQLDDLCEAPSDTLIRRTLRNLPNGLIETYERILKKIWRDTIKREMVRKIFMWMVCAQRPLGIEEVREAAGFEPQQKSWDSDMLPDADLMTEACKGLVLCDRQDGIVRFAHHTVQQFLLSDHDRTQECNLRCTEHEAQLFVGEMCLTYLLFSDFETQVQVRPTQSQGNLPRQAAPAYLVADMLGVRASKLERPFRFLGLSSSSSAPIIDQAKYMRPVFNTKAPAPIRDLTSKYRLLEYIVDSWVFHTKGFDPSSPLSRKLQDLAMYKTLPFEFRPWGRNEHFGPYGCVSCKPGGTSSAEADRLPFMSLLHFAAEAGHCSLMEPLVDEYCVHEAENEKELDLDWDAGADRWLLTEPLFDKLRSSKEKTNDQTVFIATRKGHLSAVERIFRRIDPIFKAPDLINAAAFYGHESIVGHCLDLMRRLHGGMFSTFVQQRSHITLALAAANGHQAIVESLWRGGALFDMEVDRLGETAISAAAANGHDDVVRFLITKGARLLRDGSTPLHRAAENGQSTVVLTISQLPDILDYYDLLSALDYAGETPLLQAARNGHAEVVKVMLEFLGARTALHLAAKNGHLAVIRLLYPFVRHFDKYVTDELEQTPLELATKGNHGSVLEWLLNRRSTRDDLVHKYFQLAVSGGHYNVVQVLVDRHPILRSTHALVLAAENESEVTLEVILDAHRHGRERTHVHADTTKNLLFKAFEEAQANGLDDAARLLKHYWRQEK